MDTREEWFREIAHGLFRFVAGFQLWQHGAQKLLGFFRAQPRDVPLEWFSLMWTAGVIEFFGGALIAFGLFTRPVAFVLTGHMAVIFWWRHFPPFWPLVNRGEPAVLYCFMFLLLWAWGGGAFSIDAVLAKRKAGATP